MRVKVLPGNSLNFSAGITLKTQVWEFFQDLDHHGSLKDFHSSELEDVMGRENWCRSRGRGEQGVTAKVLISSHCSSAQLSEARMI